MTNQLITQILKQKAIFGLSDIHNLEPIKNPNVDQIYDLNFEPTNK